MSDTICLRLVRCAETASCAVFPGEVTKDRIQYDCDVEGQLVSIDNMADLEPSTSLGTGEIVLL